MRRNSFSGWEVAKWGKLMCECVSMCVLSKGMHACSIRANRTEAINYSINGSPRRQEEYKSREWSDLGARFLPGNWILFRWALGGDSSERAPQNAALWSTELLDTLLEPHHQKRKSFAITRWYKHADMPKNKDTSRCAVFLMGFKQHQEKQAEGKAINLQQACGCAMALQEVFFSKCLFCWGLFCEFW